MAATLDGSATLDTGHGGTNTESFHSGDIVWVNGCKAGTPLGGDQQDYFDLIRFKDDGSALLVPSIMSNGHLNTRPTCLGIGPNLPYAEVEPFFQSHGYVRDKDFFLFVYDWRYPAEARRSRLDALVSQVKQQSGGKVDMIAHSLGALVARDYLVNWSARESVGHAVMLGGVHLGTPIAAAAITHGIGLGGCTLEPQLKQQSPPCSFRASEVQDIMRTLPSARELSPSPAYYDVFGGHDPAHPIAYIDDRPVLSGGSSLGTYDALQARMTESHAAAPLRGLAETLQQDDLGWIARAPAGTGIDLVAGTGFCTLGQIRDYQEVVPPSLPYLLEQLTHEPRLKKFDVAVYVQATSC